MTQQQLADAAGREDAEEVVVEGKTYFVCDSTPPRNFFLIMKPILGRYGFFLTSWVVPERWAKVSLPQRGTGFHRGTLRASLSRTFLQTLPDLVTPSTFCFTSTEARLLIRDGDRG